MRARFLCLFLLLSLLPLLSSAVGGRGEPLLGGWRRIKNVQDAHVQEIADFAVAEHNKAEKANLVLKRVVSGETQVVSGIKYRLILEAQEGDGVGSYEAVVWEKAWENFRSLTSFKPFSS